MRRTTALLRGSIRVCILLYMAFAAFAWCLTEPPAEKAGILPLSTAYAPAPGWTTGKTPFPTVVEWEGRTYEAEEGTAVLMEVITDATTDATIRANALERLSRLRSREATPQLLALYPKMRDWREKNGVIQCLMWSEDPRGFPLLTQLLENEQDDVVRLAAAIALARWNIRRGVHELVMLLESEVTLGQQDVRTPHVRDNALDMFMTYNRRKGWGFSEHDIQQANASTTDLADLDDEQRWAVAIAEIKKWFAANKDRFPEWKAGDPLPEVETPDKPDDVQDNNK